MTVAVLDACVLYSASLRDLFMWIAIVGSYAPRWSQHIQDEWVRHVLAKNPDVTAAKLKRTCDLMAAAVPLGLVEGFESLIPTIQLPDPDDRHVLAAAVHCDAEYIVTENMSDFPPSATSPYGVDAILPDAFLHAVYNYDPSRFVDGIRKHRASLENPAKSPVEYLATLEGDRLLELALILREHVGDI